MASGSCALLGTHLLDPALGLRLRPRTVAKFACSQSSRPGFIPTRSSTSSLPGTPSTALSASASSPAAFASSRSVALLEERFAIVENEAATQRAAADEALALAKAAAAAAKRAAAFADPASLSVIESLDMKAKEDWGFSSLPSPLDLPTSAASLLPDLPLASRMDWHSFLGLSASASGDLKAYISDKQKLAAAFSPDSSPQQPRNVVAKPRGPLEPASYREPVIAAQPVRVFVASGKKGKRNTKVRRSSSSRIGSSGREGGVGDSLATGAVPPGSMRDLLDTANKGLLSAEEEVALTTSVQAMMRLEKEEVVLAERLGRKPTKEEWAAAVGLTPSALEKALCKGRRDKKMMISCNMGLVVSSARKYASWNLSVDEILTQGCGGLIRAVEKFDPKRGFRFSTCAHWWIRQAVGRCVTDQSRTVRIPPHLYEILARVGKAKDMLVRELGRNPAEEEVAELVGLSVTRLRKILRSSRPMVSMDKPVSGNPNEDGEQTLGMFVSAPEDDNNDVRIERALLNKDLQNALHTLQPREREVLKLRFGLTDGRLRTLEEVGLRFNVTRERIRQLEHRAVRKLREPGRADVLVEYME